MAGEKPSSRPATLADVAQLAEVSVAAASRALNGGVRGSDSGDPARRKRILAAAAKLGYSASVAAQATKGGRAQSVAVVVSDMDDYGAAAMIAGIMHAAEGHGVSVTVRSTLDDAHREEQILTQLRGERHRAVIMATSRSTDQIREQHVSQRLRRLSDDGARVVVIGDNELGFPTVSVDITHAVADLIAGVLRHGHRRVMILAGPESEVTSLNRTAQTLEALEAAGVPVSDVRVIHTDFSRDGGYRAASEIRTLLESIDVILAMSDTLAVGAIAGLRHQGISSSDFPVFAGFDHIGLVSDLIADFSSVEIPFDQFGDAALALSTGDPSNPSAVVTVRARAVLSEYY